MFEHFRPTRTGYPHTSLSDLPQTKVQYISLGLPTFYVTLFPVVNRPCRRYESLVDFDPFLSYVSSQSLAFRRFISTYWLEEGTDRA